MRRRCTALLLGLALSAPAWAVTPWQAQELTDAIAAGTWEQSEKLCREVLPKTPDTQEALAVKYNLGLSLLQQKKNEEAVSLFETVAKDAADKSLRAKASYNLGNTLFAMDKMDEAQKAFEESLLLDSNDDDARYNIEVILRKKKQDEQNKQQQNQDKKDQNKDENQDKDDQNKDQQSKNDENKDQNKDGKPDQNKDGKPDEQQKGEPKKDGQGQQPPEDQRQGDAQNGKEQGGKDKGEQREGDTAMSAAEKKAAEEAQERARLLEYFRQQERDNQPRRVGVQATSPPPGGKTW